MTEDIQPHNSPESIALIKAMSLEERLRRTLDLCELVQSLAIAGIKHRNPQLTPIELKSEFKKMRRSSYSQVADEI